MKNTVDYCRLVFRRLVLFIGILAIIAVGGPVKAEMILTEEERDYIKERTVVKAVSLEGAGPIQYRDKHGQVQGISKQVLEQIAEDTGLIFEYELYDSLSEAYKSDADIAFGIPKNYAPQDMVLSKPFLKSETILYVNSALDSKQLKDKRYAAVRGSALPQGIEEENAIYFDTREESLDAVEKGQADYGYGNAYSVAFYMLQNDYKNIVTVPRGKEAREYRIGFLREDDMLLSIINKSIDAIDGDRMQSLILDVAAYVDRSITLSMILGVYGREIFSMVILLMGILLSSVISNVRANNNLKMQNKRYEHLSHISNEYLYEYNARANHLELSDRCAQLFGTGELFNRATGILKDSISRNNSDRYVSTVDLPLVHGGIGVFKIIGSSVYDNQGRLDTIIGKLIDISEEVAEKDKLVIKSQTDSLTGLYNFATTRDLITTSMKNKAEGDMDAFILVDCDNFKDVNDTFGHLIGDKVLENMGWYLKRIFRNTDIIGRIGGDEFCIYAKDIPHMDMVREKSRQLNIFINNAVMGVYVSVSIGVAVVRDDEVYEDVFEKADKALYQAKANGGGQVIIHGEEDYTPSSI